MKQESSLEWANIKFTMFGNEVKDLPIKYSGENIPKEFFLRENKQKTIKVKPIDIFVISFKPSSLSPGVKKLLAKTGRFTKVYRKAEVQLGHIIVKIKNE